MPSITEKTIFNQFDYWRRAPEPPWHAPREGVHALVGCGTSFNIAMSAAAAFSANGLAAVAVPGNEWLRRPNNYVADPAAAKVLALSRSGESSETVAAATHSRESGLDVVAITCARGSSIERAAARSLFSPTDPDEGIVMTTSASLMLLNALRYAGIAVDAAACADAAQALLTAVDAAGPALVTGFDLVVCLGGGPLYGIAAEGALKLQEMSQTYTQAFHPLEYRHGPMSLVSQTTLVVLLYHPDTVIEEARLAHELSRRGATVLGFGGPGDRPFAVEGGAAERGLILLPALQLLGERLAGLRALDTTQPKHLSRVVQAI